MLKHLLQKRVIHTAGGSNKVSKINPISSNEKISVNINNSQAVIHDLSIPYKLDIYNNENTYGISVDTVKNKNNFLYGTPYFLTQFTGKIEIGDTILYSSDLTDLAGIKSAVAITNVSINEDNEKVYTNSIVFQYTSITDLYQYAQIKMLSDGSFIIIATMSEDIKYYDGNTNSFIILPSKSNDIRYQFFMARMMPILPDTIGNNGWAKTLWIKRIHSSNLNVINPVGVSDIYIDIDQKDNNIYMVGSYSGRLEFNPDGNITPPTTNLPNDMFVSRFNSDGVLVWIQSSLKENINSNQVSTGNIRGYSLAVNNDGVNTYFIAIGGYDSTFSLRIKDTNFVETLDNQFISENMWVSKFDSDGNVIWLIGPGSNFDPNDNNDTLDANDTYLAGNQIIHSAGNSYYIVGEYVGDFTFNSDAEVFNNNDVPNLFIVNLNDAKITPDWDWVKTISTYVPDYVSSFPHITYINQEIYINFFGMFGTKFYNDDNNIDDYVLINGSGSLDNIVNFIDINGIWGDTPIYVAGAIQNSSPNIVSGPIENVKQPYYLVGTHNVGFDGSNSYFIKYLSNPDE
jgi:hypothetical protein